MVHFVCFSSINYNASSSFAASLAAEVSSYIFMMSKRNIRDNASQSSQYIYYVSCADFIKYRIDHSRIYRLIRFSTHSLRVASFSSLMLLASHSSLHFVTSAYTKAACIVSSYLIALIEPLVSSHLVSNFFDPQ